MSTYQAKKNMAREEAIEWQEYAAKQSMSYEAVAVAQFHFEQLGRPTDRIQGERNLLKERNEC